MESKTVRMAALKNFAATDLTAFPLTREVIIKQPDELDAGEFLVRTRIWLQILLTERQLGGSR